ncbi:helicase-exonuclease AddAB subunit AddA [Macrococcus hajekii]|uniref:ATP-dependent helicase/nuclease subunit A n=1 Tax=Macrococcus hajekii TaxID=198482 RepID=A0A4R6BNK8_9STAP|nr:helicase-exonuclease AddAB subunit AddA [Macrococcus hajekii]TDM03454.1 helicase-exonuclease AddAB subunit AddA [Macrococcus hajekii]GGA99018.1 ATP-dependent helicase/nuclease subunit A [Macrococcus hajekii]
MRTKPAESRWTDGQWQAITAQGSDILVAAAAGSGKTAVLVERIIQKIIYDHVALDELLVVTFTNASAKEMKERIHQALKREMIKQPTEHLKEQLVKIHAAEISTLHRFCLSLIEQYYYTIDLDPAFRTASDEEGTLLLMQSLDEVMEKYYSAPTEPFLRTNLHLSSDRSDQPLRDAVQKLYYFAVANPEPIKWLRELPDLYRDVTLDHPIVKEMRQTVLQDIERAIMLFRESAQQLDSPVYEKQYLKAEAYIQTLEQISGDFESLYHHMTGLEKWSTPMFKFKKELEDMRLEPSEEERIKDQLNQAKDILTALQTDYFFAPPAELIANLNTMAEEMELLGQLTIEVIENFTQNKRDRKILDFSDYEHLALDILLTDGERTPIADNLRAKYQEILVDEYQDTNRVQERILQSINDDHLFMVGDVKQSIYKFRQAEPGLFLDKYKRFDSTKGQVIDLSRNFRSRREVIEDTNKVFESIMDEAVGEVAYDDRQQLYFGAAFDDEPHPTELNVLVKDDAIDHMESEWIARKIKEIVDKGQVYEDGQYRPATYRDIVILQRQVSDTNSHQHIFKKYGIPFHVNSRTGYFETDEIRTMISLLRIIDNPLQDNHLVGVLRSLLYQFNEAELVDIRQSRQYFYQDMLDYAQMHHHPLALKVQHFLKSLDSYRSISRTVGVRQLLEMLYEELYIVEKYSLLASGEQRRANLLGLLTKAEDFERSSYRGLFQFIRYVDNMIEKNKDFGEVNILSDAADVVRLMTIHASKGLEFPYVIYAELGKQFNMRDLSGAVLPNQKLGVAITYYDHINHYSYPTLLSQYFKKEGRRESISESMRLMYVAFTRAKEQLILVGSATEKEIEKWRQADVYDAAYRLSASKPLELILAADVLDTHIVTQLEPSIEDKETHEVAADKQSPQWLTERAEYEYPYLELNKLPTKESVSDIKRQTEVDDDATTWTLVNQYQLERATFERPKFMSEVKKTAAERGTLMHTVMQHFPYDGQIKSVTEIEALLMQLVDKKIIAEDDKKIIDYQALIRFSASRLYQEMSQATARYTELPFVIGKSYLTGQPVQDSTVEPLVQGMIDCVYYYHDAYYFVDFKTDRLIKRKGGTIEDAAFEARTKYKVQMHYYRKALEEMLKKPVKGYLYFFDYQEVEVEA